MTVTEGPRDLLNNFKHVGKEIQTQIVNRIGQIGGPGNITDNGFYMQGSVYGQTSTFLVDNGSTVTLLSQNLFQKIDKTMCPSLQESNIVLNDVNGKNINTYGVAKMSIRVGKISYENE